MSRYINVEKILAKKKLFNVIITATGTRKSTNFGRWAKEQACSGKHVVWIRRRKENISSTVVDMFTDIFVKDGRGVPRITSKGVKLGMAYGFPHPAQRFIHFVSLQNYTNFKGKTGIAENMAGIVYDEAIPEEDETWLGNDTLREGAMFSRLINIIARNSKIPIFYLCNPNTRGSFMMRQWFPDYEPDPSEEKFETSSIDDQALIYSLPNFEEDRGTIEHLEDDERKEITKYGVFRKDQYLYITNKQMERYLATLVIGSRCLDIGKFVLENEEKGENVEKREVYLLADANLDRPEKEVVVFSRSNFIKHSGSIIRNKEKYAKWISNLVSENKLYFSDNSIKDFVLHGIDKTYFW